jgi:hypothetical protein
MNARTLLVAASTASVFAACAVGGCFQQVDSNAAGGAGLGADDAGNPDALTNWQICQSPSCDLPSGDIPFLDQTPLIYLADGSTTTNPCAEVEQASIVLRQKYCVSCHEGSVPQGSFGFVLDDTMLASAVSETAGLDSGIPGKLIVPGAPYQSGFYVSVARSLANAASGMPPPGTNPRPNAADLSVLYAWITACFSGTDAGAYELGGGSYPVDGGPGTLPGETDAGTD